MRRRAIICFTIALLFSTCALSCQPKQSVAEKQPEVVQPNQDPVKKQPEVIQHHQDPLKTYRGVGVVTKINEKFPSVELNHEEIKDLMPAMIMEYYVKDKSLLDNIKVGDKVDFTIETKNGTEVVSEIRKQ